MLKFLLIFEKETKQMRKYLIWKTGQNGASSQKLAINESK